MKTVSMLEFRHHAEKIISLVRKGERLVLTYRGKPVARLEPIVPDIVPDDDAFFALDRLSDAVGASLTNTQIDEIVYGP